MNRRNIEATATPVASCPLKSGLVRHVHSSVISSAIATHRRVVSVLILSVGSFPFLSVSAGIVMEVRARVAACGNHIGRTKRMTIAPSAHTPKRERRSIADTTDISTSHTQTMDIWSSILISQEVARHVTPRSGSSCTYQVARSGWAVMGQTVGLLPACARSQGKRPCPRCRRPPPTDGRPPRSAAASLGRGSVTVPSPHGS